MRNNEIKEIEMNEYCATCSTHLGEGAEGWCTPCYEAWEQANGLRDLDWMDEEMMREGVA